MIKQLLLSTVCLASFNCLHAQQMHFYNGTVPIIDGILSPGEWTDADSCQITISGSVKATVRFKHDGSAMYFVFYNNLESAVRCPEINLDINNSKSAVWEGDDWWFHSSGTDCENNGAPNVYSDCLAVQPDWEAVPNFVSGGANEDTVELRVPFSKIGFVYSGGIDTIGIALDVTNTFSAWNMYPATAVVGNPSTWANGIFYNYAMGVGETGNKIDFTICPNPVTDQVMITCNTEKTILSIFDVGGNCIRSQRLINGLTVIDLGALPAGIYQATFIANGVVKAVRFVKSR